MHSRLRVLDLRRNLLLLSRASRRRGQLRLQLRLLLIETRSELLLLLLQLLIGLVNLLHVRWVGRPLAVSARRRQVFVGRLRGGDVLRRRRAQAQTRCRREGAEARRRGVSDD